MTPKHIYAVHPAGYLVQFELGEDEHVADAVELLVEREYRPSHGDAWPRTPEGLPICPKHGEVMSQREKQGDTWYSHKVIDANGEVLYCRGYAGKSSPGWNVPRAGVKRESERQASRQQQTSAQQQPPPPEPPSAGIRGGDESPHYEHENERLPDYRAMALGAKTAAEFDYAAYMTLRNGMCTDQDRIAKTREALVPGWKAGERSNPAMLAALEAYREKRTAAEGRGEAPTAAHQFAKREAMGVYNKAIGEK